jgi:hypothetical protein
MGWGGWAAPQLANGGGGGGHAFGDTGELDALVFVSADTSGIKLDVTGGYFRVQEGDASAVGPMQVGKVVSGGASLASAPFLIMNPPPLNQDTGVFGGVSSVGLTVGGSSVVEAATGYINVTGEVRLSNDTFISRASAGEVNIGATTASADGTAGLANINFSGTITGGGSGVITNPGSGLRSELFGVSAADNGADDCVIIGSTASVAAATDDNCVVIGSGASATGGAGLSVVVGQGASTSAQQSIVIGPAITNTIQRAVVIGHGASLSATFATAVGHAASAAGNASAFGNNSTAAIQGTAVGSTATTTGNDCIALGYAAAATNDSCALGSSAVAASAGSIAVGHVATTTKANQFVVGSSNQNISEVVIGDGVTNAAPMAQLLFTTTNGTGTDIHATDLVLQSGLSTGAGAVTDMIFKTPDVLTTGTTTQTAVERLKLNEAGAHFSGTLLFSEGTATDTPASTKVAIYAKADGLVYSKDDAGTETLMSSGAAGGTSFVGFTADDELDMSTYQIVAKDIDASGFLSLGVATTATAAGDLASGDGIREFTWDNSAGTLDLTNAAGVNYWTTASKQSLNIFAGPGFAHYNYAANASPGSFVGTKARGTPAAPTILLDGDKCVQLTGNAFLGFIGGDGVVQMGTISVRADGPPTTSSAPGEIVFATTPSAATAVTDRWRFSNDGNFEPIADSSYNIGTTTVRPANVYTDSINVGSSATATSAGDALFSDGTRSFTFTAADGSLELGGATSHFLTQEHSSAPGTPASNNVAIYAKSNGLVYSKDDAGTETLMSGGAAGADPGWELLSTQQQTSGTTLSYTVPSSTLSVDGDYLVVEVVYQASASSQTAQLKWDGTIFIASDNTFDSGENCLVQGRIYRTGATSQNLIATSALIAESSVQGAAHFGRAATDAATLSGTVDILADYASAGSNVVFSMTVWKVSA